MGQLGDPTSIEKEMLSFQKNFFARELDLSYSKVEGQIISIAAGKYHSLFLTDLGKVYGIGNNRFGQLGLNNTEVPIANDFVKIEFEKDEFIKEIKTGDNHNIFLTDKGKIYVNGDNSIGQVNGVLDNDIEYFSTPVLVPFQHKAIEIKAKNFRSYVKLENGDCNFWGGFYYLPDTDLKALPKIDGINLFNKEDGIVGNVKEIVDVGLGLFHDVILVDYQESINI